MWFGAKQGALHPWVLGEQQLPGVLPVQYGLACHVGRIVLPKAGRRSVEVVSFHLFRID